MADYNAYPAGYFLGNVETFRFTASSQVPENSLVTAGRLMGFTRQAFQTGETGIAFLSGKMSHYNIPLETAATVAIPQGTAIYVTSSGQATTTATGNTLVGCLYQAVEVGDEYADVLLYLPAGASETE